MDLKLSGEVHKIFYQFQNRYFKEALHENIPTCTLLLYTLSIAVVLNPTFSYLHIFTL